MPRRRRIRLRCTAPDGRIYILEQEHDRKHAQIRIWLPTSKRYKRMTVPFDLRAPDPTKAMRAAAVQYANARVVADIPVVDVTPGRLPTLGDILELACDPATTRKREPGSDQSKEWIRARQEVLAILPSTLPLAQLSGEHVAAVAISATLRRACGRDVDQWAELLRTQHIPKSSLPGPGELTQATEDAYRDVIASGATPSTITFTWSRRVVELLRAMIRHIATRHIKYDHMRGFRTPSDFMNDVREVSRRLGIAAESRPFRPTREADEARALMRELSDPRYRMRDALATLVGENGSSALLASDIRVVDGRVEVHCQRRQHFAHRKAWHACEPGVSAAIHALLLDQYAVLEAERTAGGPDYRIVADVRWDGARLRRIRSADDASDAEADALLDPRAWLLFTLGAEGRMGQVVRSTRASLHVEGNTKDLVLDVPDTDRKRASYLLLAKAQQAAVAFALCVGYLAELEREHREGRLDDFPLFPKGRLASGRAKLTARGAVDDRTLNDWARDVERRLGLQRVHGEGLYGWRRAFINLFDRWSTSARTKDLLTGHASMSDPSYGSTRVTVYLDPKDLPHLQEAQALLQHVRTEFIRTGRPPQGVASPPEAGDEQPRG